jgi:predicted AlkP superfamily pyrophosphatase or phosphodiesterase
MPTRIRRRLRALALIGAAALLAVTCGRLGVTAPATAHAATTLSAADASACSLPHQVLLRVWRGFRADRSGDLLIVPKPFYYIDGGRSHSTPWPYTQDIPMLWYGPSFVPAQGAVNRPVQMVDVAPTMADLLHFDGFHAPDGKSMTEAVDPQAPTPKLIVVVVWDAGGRDVLNQWPDSWPNLKALIPKGTWYEHATVGSSPSVTPPSHANLGTGAYPFRHGEMDNQDRINGTIVGSFSKGPALLAEPTLADIYDLAMGNRPKVGIVATIPEHMGMIGHGSFWQGGDKDVAVLSALLSEEGAESKEWNLPRTMSPYFRFPAYVRDLPSLSTYLDYADAIDGVRDGLWRGHTFAAQKSGFDTPARIPYETRAIQDVITREGFGADGTPDLLFTNYKLIDEIGHEYFSTSLEMKDSVQAQDEMLPGFIDFLNRQVGRDRWVMLVTADHGHVPDPAVSGGFSIKSTTLESQLNARFGAGAVDKIRPTQIYMHMDVLANGGFTLDDVSSFLLGVTKGDNRPPPQVVPADQAHDPVFDAAFPGADLTSLPCLPEARAAA